MNLCEVLAINLKYYRKKYKLSQEKFAEILGTTLSYLNQIENKKVEVPQTKEMNDKDYITTMLTIEKAMVKDYATALTEASNNDLYNDYLEMFNDVSTLQRDIYNLMFKKGWYQLEMAQDNKIQEKLNCLTNEISQLNDK